MSPPGITPPLPALASDRLSRRLWRHRRSRSPSRESRWSRLLLFSVPVLRVRPTTASTSTNTPRHSASAGRPKASGHLLIRPAETLASGVCAESSPTSRWHSASWDLPRAPAHSRPILANTGRPDLPCRPDGSGLRDPLAGMDACVQPNGWPLLLSSGTELQKGTRGPR